MIRGTGRLRLIQGQPQPENLAQTDTEIAELLAATHMPGKLLELDYDARPSFLQALACQGFSHDLVLIQPENFHGLAGMGIRSLRHAFLDGKAGRIGYLHHLRLHPDIRGGPYLARGYRAVRQFYLEQPAPVTLTSILAENLAAQEVLESKKAGKTMPTYEKISRYLTALIPLSGPGKRWPVKFRKINVYFTSRTLCEKDLNALCQLFNDAGKSNDGLPAVNRDSFANGDFPGLGIEDFVGIFAGQKLIAACGIWNQQPLKQIRVRKLGALLRFTRKIWRAAGAVIGPCPIPDEGQQVNQVLLDPWVILPGYEKKAAAILLENAAKIARQRGFDFAAWGVAEAHPAICGVKSVYFIPYWSIIYQVYWPEQGAYNFSNKQLQLINLGAL